MKRVLFGVFLAVGTLVTPAFAGPYPPPRVGGDRVLAETAARTEGDLGGLASTGAGIGFWLVVAALLIAGGFVSLVLARRRSAPGR